MTLWLLVASNLCMFVGVLAMYHYCRELSRLHRSGLQAERRLYNTIQTYAMELENEGYRVLARHMRTDAANVYEGGEPA